jgi:dTDP-glucose 4,6-dehydratase
MKSILITGGAGFIGSNFINYFINKYKDYRIINLDKLTYAADLKYLKNIENSPSYKFIKGDICERKLIADIFKDNEISGVIHFAAESHVDNSILKPDDFIQTNIIGTFNLIDSAKNFWMEKPFKYKKEYTGSCFHHISTDEVYGTLAGEGFFTEKTPYAPNSPYSASKASSDMLVRSYHHTYGLNTLITNCSNNYGPHQHDEKFIPTIIRNALKENPIPVYGKGENIRDWLYVADHCRAIDLVFHKGKSGETYNVGTRNEVNNIDLVNKICRLLDGIKPRKSGKSYMELISYVNERPGHDYRYAIDPAKIESELNFSSCMDFDSGLMKTIQWYMEKYEKNN